MDDKELIDATAPLSFADFLEKMKDPAAADLVRSIKNFIKTYDDRKPDPERDGQHVQQFLAKSEGAFRQHPVWASGPPEHQAQAIEGLEKYLMTKIYHKTFATSPLDRERDDALNVRMNALNFIKPQHLDIPPALHDEKAWLLAMKELHKIDSYKAPRDKLVCILNCCRIINNMLHVSVQQGEARGADDFLPILIYVVIHANPPQLASNLEYIQRFRMQSRMVSESSYFFTQLYSAASFIETINSSSLTMDADEFMARMMAAGMPDMQLLPSASSRDAPGAEAKPSTTAAEPEPRQADAGAIEGAAPSEPAAAQAQGFSSSYREGSGGAGPASLEELEQAGVSHVLEAEARGELLKRHPYIYARAADLRLADVEAVLSAYKQLALRYEALSLAFAHETGANVGLSPNTPRQQPATDTLPVAGPPPAGLRPLGIESLMGDFSLQTSPRSDLPGQSAQPDPILALKLADVGGTEAVGSTSVPLNLAADATPATADMMTSASLRVPYVPQPSLEPVIDPNPPRSEPPGSAAAVAAAAFESVTATLASSARSSFSSPRFEHGSAAESPSEVKAAAPVQRPAAIPELDAEPESTVFAPPATAEVLPSAQTEPPPLLAPLTSEVALPRQYLSTPFGDPPTAKEIELPRPQLPSPFQDLRKGTAAEPSPLPADAPPPAAAAADSSGTVDGGAPPEAAVTVPSKSVASPFVEEEISTSFPAPSFASPFDAIGGDATEGDPEASLAGELQHHTEIVDTVTNSPFAASSGMNFQDGSEASSKQKFDAPQTAIEASESLI